jgi:hypothetical protein
MNTETTTNQTGTEEGNMNTKRHFTLCTIGHGKVVHAAFGAGTWCSSRGSAMTSRHRPGTTEEITCKSCRLALHVDND